ncbi:hypothetical protein AGRO_5482 [Agrobacterium sp. ATCC 31749]|nr:hypothetical protein AGRO_5482 [Agrobacterium sp. ATCC 31749]
MELSFMLCSGV